MTSTAHGGGSFLRGVQEAEIVTVQSHLGTFEWPTPRWSTFAEFRRFLNAWEVAAPPGGAEDISFAALAYFVALGDAYRLPKPGNQQLTFAGAVDRLVESDDWDLVRFVRAQLVDFAMPELGLAASDAAVVLQRVAAWMAAGRLPASEGSNPEH